jgi:putative hemolysin
MTETFIILGLLILNGFFAMCEIALVSSRKSKLEQKAKQGSKGAITALDLLKEPEKFLSTVQIGITLVGIVAGAYGGEAFTKNLQPYLEQITWLKPYAEQTAFVLIVTVITYFSLIIGELVPKSIALNNPESITITFAPFMRGLSIVTYPFVAFLSLSTKLLLKILMIKERNEPPVSEDELKYMIETGSQHGIIEKQESEIMHSVFKFGDSKADHVMTRKKDITWININQSKQEMLAIVFQSAYTKFPVCEDSLDKILGVVSLKNILMYAEDKKLSDLNDYLIEPIFFPLDTPALKILATFRKKRIHIGFVVNEYGGTEGVVTLHDLVENIIGDFPEIGDNDEAQIIKREDGSLLVDGELEIDKLKNALNIDILPNEKSYVSLAGFIIYQLHLIPKAGDNFVMHNYKFEVMDMDRNRIDKVLISPVKCEQKNK